MKRDQTVGCTGCREDHRHFLHNVRHRGSFHRLCTSCVLKFHPGSFCACCLDLFEASTPSDSIKCSKCTAIAHSSCIRPETAVASSSYVCPSCSNPSFSFFDVGAAYKRSRAAADGEPKKAIDLKSAKALLAAARIAAVSMSKAANSMRSEAERKVREAALARKRAREALERADSVASKEKERVRGKEAKEGASISTAVADPKKKPKGNSAVAAAAAVVAQKRVQSHKLGAFTPAPLGNAGSREKEKWGGFQATAVLVHRAPKKGVVEGKEKSTGSPSSVLGRQHLQNHALDEEKEKLRAMSGSSVPGQQQQSQNSSCMIEEEKEDQGKAKGFTDSDSGPQKPNPSNQSEQS